MIDDEAPPIGKTFDPNATPPPPPPPPKGKGASQKTSPPGGGASGAPQKPSGKPTKFKLIPFEDIRFDAVLEWVIKKLLPRQGLAVLFGLPRTFKSFIAFDIAMYVALGWAWADRTVAQGDAIYIAAENAAGIRKRKIGFEQAHQHDLPSGRIPFYLIETAPNLGTEKHDLAALIASIEAVSPTPRLIVIDTLAQTLAGGEENNTGMVTFVANATALANHFKCCVIVIHHSPIADDQRLRGHTSLQGGADAALLTERPNNDLATTLILKKLKDEEDSLRLVVRLDRIIIGQDGDGDEISTLVIGRIETAETTAAVKGKPSKSIPRGRRLLMDMVKQAIDEAGQDFRSFSDGSIVRAVHDEAVRLRYYVRIAEEAAPDELPAALAARQRQAFNRAVKAALDAKDIVARNDNDKRYLWLP